MANPITEMTQNDRQFEEVQDASTLNLVNSDTSWTIVEDVDSAISGNQSDLEGIQTQQAGISADDRRLDEFTAPSHRSSCEERGSNRGEPTKELGGKNITRRCRRYNAGDRPIHSRRSIHDMTKPLRSWLSNHKDNPYPSKTDKLTLSASSEMTLIQVSNWFANARRRLKNTIGQQSLTWRNRIKLYKKRAQGNADQLSYASSRSGDVEADLIAGGEMPALGLHEHPLNTQTPRSPSNNQSQSSATPSAATRAESPPCLQAPPTSSQIEMCTTETAHLHKFKQNILHRYLNDSAQHQHFDFQYGALQTETRTPSMVHVTRDSMGSTGDFDDVSSTSPNSTASDGNRSIFQDGRTPYDVDFRGASVGQTSRSEEEMSQTMEGHDTYWKEIVAAVVLTNMARAKRHLLPLGMMT